MQIHIKGKKTTRKENLILIGRGYILEIKKNI